MEASSGIQVMYSHREKADELKKLIEENKQTAKKALVEQKRSQHALRAKLLQAMEKHRKDMVAKRRELKEGRKEVKALKGRVRWMTKLEAISERKMLKMLELVEKIEREQKGLEDELTKSHLELFSEFKKTTKLRKLKRARSISTAVPEAGGPAVVHGVEPPAEFMEVQSEATPGPSHAPQNNEPEAGPSSPASSRSVVFLMETDPGMIPLAATSESEPLFQQVPGTSLQIDTEEIAPEMIPLAATTESEPMFQPARGTCLQMDTERTDPEIIPPAATTESEPLFQPAPGTSLQVDTEETAPEMISPAATTESEPLFQPAPGTSRLMNTEQNGPKNILAPVKSKSKREEFPILTTELVEAALMTLTLPSDGPEDQVIPESGVGASSQIQNGTRDGSLANSSSLAPGSETAPQRSVTHRVDSNRPLGCVCGKSFKNLKLLKVHIQYFTGKYVKTCSICGKQFGHTGNLNKHMRNHHNTENRTPPATVQNPPSGPVMNPAQASTNPQMDDGQMGSPK